MITIEKISVEDFAVKINNEEKQGARLTCDIDIDGKKDTLFFECEEKWKKYLLTERADAFVVLLLPVAMREKHDIVSNLPITEKLKENLEKMFIPTLCANDKSLYSPTITAKTENKLIGGNAVGTANSLGVDSFYTIYKYANAEDENLRITHFYMGAVSLDLWRTHSKNLFEYLEKKKYNYERYKLVADELGKELIMTFSNFIKFMCKKFGYVHITVHAYITLAEILCLKKLWKTYLFSAGYTPKEYIIKDTRHADSSHYDDLTTKALSVPDLKILCSGEDVSRYEKTKILADYPMAQKYLRPCFNYMSLNKKQKMNMTNCGRSLCPKCLRLLVSADVSGNLEKFKNVVDIEKYKKHRRRYLRLVVWGKNRSPFMAELYPLCLEKYPKLVKSIERFKNFITFHWIKIKKINSYKYASCLIKQYTY